MVLLVLALIWAAALLPPLVRSRLEGNPADSVGRFRRHLRVLESTGPAASSLASDPSFSVTGHGMPKAWAAEARRLRKLRRRQSIARGLFAIMASTLALGVIPGFHKFLILHVVSDVAFAIYVFLLVQARNIEVERRTQAHFAALHNQQTREAAYPIDPHQASSL